jgi:DNA-binding IclR family transcriptional regulator
VGVREVAAARPHRLGAQERTVLELVSRGAGIDNVGREAGLDAAAVRAMLARLELRGLVRRAPTGAYHANC